MSWNLASQVTEKSRWALLLLITLVMAATSYQFTPAVPGLLLPLIFLQKKDWGLFAGLAAFFVIKLFLSLTIDIPSGYAFYKTDYFWMAREIASVVLFYGWLLLGQRVLRFDVISRTSWPFLLFLIFLCYAIQFYFSGNIVISGINNLIVAVYIFSYFLIIGPYPTYAGFIAIVLIVLTGLLPKQSSFTVLSSLAFLLMALSKAINWEKKIFLWRITTVAAIVFLMFMSLYASMVYVRDTRATGEGNNGKARQYLAEIGYRQFSDTPLFGTPLGQGILPISAIQTLNWGQYFSDPRYNAYALSFHDSFIYLLVRYGLLSLYLFWLLIGRVPKKGPLHALIFTMILLLGTGANVVIESLRAGPAVGLALGILISLGEEPSEKKGGKPRVLEESRKANLLPQGRAHK